MSEEKTFELLGRTVTESKKTDKDGKLEKLVYQMSNKDYEAVQAEHGVTKEVKKVIAECDALVAEAAIKFISARSLENDQVPASIKLGNQDSAMELKINPYQRFEGKKPGTDETYVSEKYGVVTVTKHAKFARELTREGAVLAQVAAEHEAAFKKRNK